MSVSMLVSLPVSMCMIAKALPSPEFVTATLLEAGNHVIISSSLSESPSSSMEAFLFNSLDDILTLSTIFMQLLTLTSFEPVDIDVVSSSLALVAGEALGEALTVVPF